jgi:hypothetical protein
MGHIHLGVLPGTKRWKDVVGLLADGAAPRRVIAASAHAAEKDLQRAAGNPVFSEAVKLLSMLPVAASEEDFTDALSRLKLSVKPHPELFDILASIGDRLDQRLHETGSHDDFAELVRRSLLSNITTHVGDRLPGLIATTPADVQLAIRQTAAPREFAVYARGFFTRLVGETLRYWLDRELASHMGSDDYLADAGKRSEFDKALMQFCMEATFIVREFSAAWFQKRLYEDGEITERAAAAYGAVALKKIREELTLKWTGE